MLLRAHIAGALDLSKADVLDPRWQIKMQFIVNELAATAEHKLDEYEYQLNLALMDYGADETNFKLHLDEASVLCDKFADNLTPWEQSTGPADLRTAVKDMRQQYIETFGDPADPKFQQELERTVAYLNRAS